MRPPVAEDRLERASPFWEIGREDWSRLAPRVPNPLTSADIHSIRGLGDPLDLREVGEVYLPLSLLLSNYVANRQTLRQRVGQFITGQAAQGPTTPFVIGIAGSVAVGKSTVARLLRELLARWESTPRVQLVTTDGFLYPNAELERRGLLSRKGFPESYDRRGLLRFLSAVKSGAPEVRAPKYSHVTYDIVPNDEVVVRHPDVLIFEGLNVLQPPMTSASAAVSDYLDFGIYVDARTTDIEHWYIDRFLKLQRDSFTDPTSYFHRFRNLDRDAAVALGEQIWTSVNLPNLQRNVARTRLRADLVLVKDADHTVNKVLLRKL